MTVNSDLFRYTLDSAITEIKTFQEALYNWDGDGGLPLNKTAARKGIAFLRVLDPVILKKISAIRPIHEGHFFIIWKNGENDVSLNFEPDCYFWCYRKNGVDRCATVEKVDISMITIMVKDLYGLR